MPSPPAVGDHLRAWRQRRRLSQLDLALDARISTRHLSFLETGRARPSRGMVLRLAEQLDLPLRDRNLLLAAAGFAPAFAERPLNHPAMASARRAVDLVLAGLEPFPALLVDRHWQLVAANRAIAPLLDGVAADLVGPEMNVLRLALHPEGLAPRIANLAEWRRHLLDRLARQAHAAGDPVLDALLTELGALPGPIGADPQASDPDGIAVPLTLHVGDRLLSFISTTTVFGTATDVTLAELTLETFLPADTATAAALAEAQRASA